MVSIVYHIKAIDIYLFINYNSNIFRKENTMTRRSSGGYSEGRFSRDFCNDDQAPLHGLEGDPADMTALDIVERGFQRGFGGPTENDDPESE